MATAAVLAGARFTAVNWHLTADEVRYVVDDAGARLLVTEPAYAAVAAEAVAGLGVDVVEAGPQLDGLLAGASDEPFPPRRGRRAVDALHVRNDRPAQGRGADGPVDGRRPTGGPGRRGARRRARRERPPPRHRAAVLRGAAGVRGRRPARRRRARADAPVRRGRHAAPDRRAAVRASHLVPTMFVGCSASTKRCGSRSTAPPAHRAPRGRPHLAAGQGAR